MRINHLLLLLMFCFVGILGASAQNVTVKGTVTDATTGETLPGANISIQGTTQGTTTMLDGTFTIQVPSPNAVLEVTYIGYLSQQVPVKGRTTINIALQSDAKSLEEVVIVGYGTVRKSDLTGSVSTVDPAGISQVATVDVNQSLQGKVAGVQVTPASGAPGTGARVRIRGIGTINNSDPLYVVDGYPVGSIEFLAPTDIESMEVLKDASATAIYGNRGANGVILITTKKGRSGAPVFNFNSYAGVQNPWRRLKLANAAEYATLYREAFQNDGTPLSAADDAMTQYVIDNKFKGTDWQDEVMRKNALIQNYNFSVTGGNEKSRYGISATYFGQEGTIKNTGMQKMLFRVNNDYTFNPAFKAGWSLSYVHADINEYEVNQYSGVLPTAISTTPIIPAWDVNRNNWGETMLFSQGYNPARLADELRTRTFKQNRAVANIYADVTLFKGLTFRSNFGGDLSFNRRKIFYPRFYISPNEQRTESSLLDARQLGGQWTWSNVFSYNKDLGVHNINAMIGQEAQLQQYNDVEVTGYNLLNDPTQYYIGAAKSPNYMAASNAGHNSLLSYFGRVTYSLMDRYLLTATIRRDASSRFTQAYRVGIFPSFSAGWNVHQERFLRDINWLSTLKLRAGYGVVGNQGSLSNTATQYVVVPQQRYSFGGVPVEGRANFRLKNEDLVWETSAMSNVGLDAGFMGDRINLTLDYFVKNTYDMIVTPPVPAYVGAVAPFVNAGDMLNKGLEAALSFSNKEGAFTYDLGLNAAIIRNRVTNLGGGAPIDGGNVNVLGNTTRTEVGHEIAYFYGRKTDGIFNSQEEVDAYTYTNPQTGEVSLIQPNARPGDVKFVDINGDGVINDADRVKLGSAMPDFGYGATAFLGYKNFDLKIFFQGLYGNKTVNALSIWTESPTGIQNSLQSRMNRWTPENPTTNEPRMTNSNQNNNTAFSDRYVEDGSYLRLRNIQLGYTVPKSLIERVGVNSLRVYVSADNLLTFTKYTGYEPEVSELWGNPFYQGVDMATFPQSRTIIGGLNITF